MYFIKVEGESTSDPIIRLEGRVDRAGIIERELSTILEQFRCSPEIYIDLENAESVSEECLKMFQRIRAVYPIKFRGYSLFTEFQLFDYNLLERK